MLLGVSGTCVLCCSSVMFPWFWGVIFSPAHKPGRGSSPDPFFLLSLNDTERKKKLTDMTGVHLCNLSLNPTSFTFIPLTLLPVSDLVNLKVCYDSPWARPPRIPFFLLIFLLTFLSDSAFLSRSFHTFLFPTLFLNQGAVWAAPTKPPLCHRQPLSPCPHPLLWE